MPIGKAAMERKTIDSEEMSERLIGLLIEPPNRQQRLLLATSGALLFHVALVLGLHFTASSAQTKPMSYSLNVSLIEQIGGQLDATLGDLMQSEPDPQESASTINPTQQQQPAEEQALLSTTAPAVESASSGSDGQDQAVLAPPIDQVDTTVISTETTRSQERDTPPVLNSLLYGNSNESSPRSTDEQREDASRLEGYYAQSWRLAVEQIATHHLPQRVVDEKLTGRLTLDVAIKADGTVQSIAVIKSSGNPALDRAARQIVYLAAPFEAFPPALRRLRDVIHIVRTWEFDRGSQLRTQSQ